MDESQRPRVAATAGSSSVRSATELFDLLVERVVEYAIFLLDADGNIASWNPGAHRIKGYTADEIIGKPYSMFFSDEDRRVGRPQQILAHARDTGQFQEEGWRIRKDGQRFWASVLLTALRDDTGALRGYAKITRDLTERLKAEEEARRAAEDRAARRQAEIYEAAMRRSRDELDLILRSIREGVTVLSADGEFVFVNDAAANLCGFASAQEMMSLKAREIVEHFDLLHEDGTPFALEDLPGRKALRGESSSAVVRFRLKKSGEERWSFMSAAPVVDAQGKIDHAVTVFREFTDRRRTEQAWQFLAHASAALGSSLDHEATLAQVAALAVPAIADWCTVEVVEAEDTLRPLASAHFDPAKAELVKLWHRRWPPTPAWPVWRVLESGTPELISEVTDQMLEDYAADDEQRRALRELGMRSAMVVPLIVANKPFGTVSFVSAQASRCYREQDLILATEIGRRASLAVENARAYQEARAAVQIRDNFLSIASHELRTPLSALSILTTSLVRAAKSGRLALLDADALKDRMLMAERQTKQLAALVNRLLDVRRLSTGEMELDLAEAEIGEIVREAIARLEDPIPESERRIKLHVEGRFVGRWDRQRLDQVFTNLLSNALKYAPRSPVEVRVEPGGGDTVRVSVKDGGPGIAPEHHERIFRQFERAASDRASGMGLGLWIVARIVKGHGGSVTLDSRPGEGASFQVVLPLSRSGAADGDLLQTQAV